MPTDMDPTLSPTQDMTGAERTEIPAKARTAYQLGELLGKGGMGEVWSAKDEQLRREVALKRMRTTAPKQDELHRFLREAKIQARLDHPAVVPVYELGTDSEGFPFFTMKKLAGTTLAKLIESGKETQQRMLRVLVDVCLAIDRAHAEGIVHRDLKPSNIMVGDYGEVYVLDWGVARLLDEVETPSMAISLISSQGTRTGQLLGTPGYMAPEQVRALTIAQPADVYALGAIMFEILAGEALHPRGTAALSSTLDKPQVSPAARAPKRTIPPELDELCFEALAEDASTRPTVRELGDRIQQYLDGDRDIEHRRVLATKLVVQGRAALDTGDRAEATRLGGRALALDPNNADAAELVASIITSAPPTLPDEVHQQTIEADRAAVRERSRRAMLPLLAFFALTPTLLWLEVTSWPGLIAVFAAIGLMLVTALLNWRTGRVPLAVWLAVNTFACIVFTRMAGPFVITPIVIVAVLISASGQPGLTERRWVFVLLAIVLVTGPFALEELGLFARSWKMSSEGVVSQGTVFLRGQGHIWPLFIANVLAIILVGLFALAISRDRRLAQRQLLVQTWQLKHLLPRTFSAVGSPMASGGRAVPSG